jgi:hypothetical protein
VTFVLHEKQILAQISLVRLHRIPGKPLFHGQKIEKLLENIVFHKDADTAAS